MACALWLATGAAVVLTQDTSLRPSKLYRDAIRASEATSERDGTPGCAFSQLFYSPSEETNSVCNFILSSDDSDEDAGGSDNCGRGPLDLAAATEPACSSRIIISEAAITRVRARLLNRQESSTSSTPSPVAKRLRHSGSLEVPYQDSHTPAVTTPTDLHPDINSHQVGMASHFLHPDKLDKPKSASCTNADVTPNAHHQISMDSVGKPVTQGPSRLGSLALEILRMQKDDQAMPERIIRERLGNNPDTSKALRRLTVEGKMARTCSGGRRNPYLYHVTEQGKFALQGETS